MSANPLLDLRVCRAFKTFCRSTFRPRLTTPLNTRAPSLPRSKHWILKPQIGITFVEPLTLATEQISRVWGPVSHLNSGRQYACTARCLQRKSRQNF